jgi:ABC-type cobalamin/Fe3+-siderophores transport system ATPase subunit
MGVQFPGELAGNLRQHLAKTSIVGAVQDTRMEALSFSQKSCIVFSKLTFKCPHLLILDEPTNFLESENKRSDTQRKKRTLTARSVIGTLTLIDRSLSAVCTLSRSVDLLIAAARALNSSSRHLLESVRLS